MNAHGPLQDPTNMTPVDLLFRGIEVVEPVPNYYQFCAHGKGYALHDTPKQAVYHARWVFKIWEDEE